MSRVVITIQDGPEGVTWSQQPFGDPSDAERLAGLAVDALLEAGAEEVEPDVDDIVITVRDGSGENKGTFEFSSSPYPEDATTPAELAALQAIGTLLEYQDEIAASGGVRQ